MKDKAPGILPMVSWLCKHGYSGLVAMMKQHPEAFAHIKQQWKGGKSAQEWVPIAERLVTKHGHLPNHTWLKTHKFGGLIQAMRARPQLFKHIKQKRLRPPGKNLKEWLLVATKLAKQHHGILPAQSWLKAHGCEGLNTMMKRYPRTFAHIKQKKPKGLDGWVKEAEILAQQHGGRLPHPWWMQTHGYGSLKSVVKKHPRAFRHLNPIVHRPKTAKEYRAEALRLAGKNGGRLPTWTWRQNNGHSSLNNYMGSHANEFSDIPVDTVDKLDPAEWRPLALQLAKANGGILPSVQRLRDAGHNGLEQAIKSHPKVFADIRKENRRGKSLQEWRKVAEQLARRNHGRIPSPRWLCEHGYDTLKQRIQANRNTIFAGMTQDRCKPKRGYTRHEWVPIAETLAANNGGVLQSPAQLQRGGYAGLVAAMLKFPKLFSHIRQTKRRRRAPCEWVPIAKALIKKHGQIPGGAWLSKNKLAGLVSAMDRHPELFRHLKS